MEQQLRQINLEDDVSQRRGGIGGSDSPVILGVSPFQTKRDLFLEKVGLKEANPVGPAAMRGKRLESIVADLYAEITGRHVEIVKQKLIHPVHKHLWAHIDRKLVDPKLGEGILEIKCPGLGVFGKCEREGLPEYYLVQLAHYLGVTGKKWGSFAIFSAEKWKLIHFDVQRNERLIEIIFQKDNEFWQGVLNGIAPEEETVQIEMPEVLRGELVNMEKINPNEWAEVVKQYQVAKNLKENAEGLLEIAENSIKSMMDAANAPIAEGSGMRVYFKEQAGRQSLDKKAFAKGNPPAYEIYLDYLKQGKPMKVFRPYIIKPILIE